MLVDFFLKNQQKLILPHSIDCFYVTTNYFCPICHIVYISNTLSDGYAMLQAIYQLTYMLNCIENTLR